MNCFGEDWLNSDFNHPLQKLWKRRDILSSVELLTLGSSIIKIRSIDSRHVLENINVIKMSDRNGKCGAINGRRGAIFETILAGALHNPPRQSVELMGPRYPVYDMIVHFKDRTSINISVKNYGQSEKDELFIKEAKLVEQVIKTNLRYPLDIFIKSEGYPSQAQWDMLKRELLFDIFKDPANRLNVIIKRGNWYIFFSKIGISGGNLYPLQLSYTYFITAPFHKNEKLRLFSNLNEACRDLEKNGKPESEDSANMLYVHLPAYVLMDDYHNWCSKYFLDNPNSPISSIRLIQPAYATDLERNFSDLFILYREILKGKESDGFKLKSNRLINNFPVGSTAGEPFRVLFGKNRVGLPMQHYWYQSGHIYQFDELSGQSKITHQLRYNTGIRTHSVIRIKGEDLIVSQKSPPTYELLLL